MIRVISQKSGVNMHVIIHIHLKARNREQEYDTDATEEKHKKCFAVMYSDNTYQNIHEYSINDVL
jgi:hypothetical protein